MDNAVPKIEGHAAFYAHLKSGHVDEARMIGLENDRFVEKILLGRKYWEAPIITSRICGICPVIHNVTSTKGIEAACNIEVTKQTKLLRKLMLCGQMVQSHSLHLYLLALPDFVGASSSFDLQKNHPDIFNNAIVLKRYADRIIEAVGGRATHPVASVPGGFKSYPKLENLKKLLDLAQEALETAEKTLRLFANLKFPDIKREVVYSALKSSKEYAYYDGESINFGNDQFKPDNYTHYVYEELRPYTRAKFGSLKGHVMYVGAMARMNLSKIEGKKTNELMAELNITPPFQNPFDNNTAQAVENYFFAEKSIELIEYFLKYGIKEEALKSPRKFGTGTAACEAPRGTLFHHYELDDKGNITKCDIITPTVQALASMEADMRHIEPIIKDMDLFERNKTIEMLIRSYDPCITCATH